MRKAPIILKSFLCSALIGGMLLSFGGVANASEKETKNVIKNPNQNVITTCQKHGKHKFDPEKMKLRLQNRLAPLVKSGKLSQEKANKVVEYYYKTALERKAHWQKAKAMKPEAREEYIKKLKENRKRPLVELVKAGVITQQEADSIREAMHKKGDCPRKSH